MKKKIIFTTLSALLLLTSCGGETSSSTSTDSSSSSDTGEGNIEDFQLPAMSTLLEGTLLTNEVNSSSKVISKETSAKDVISVETTNETWNIYNNQTSFATGDVKYTYTSGVSLTDTYKKIAQVSSPYGTSLFFLVTDYEDGTKRTSWVDSATSLEVTEKEESTEGYSTLSKAQIPYQLSKQVSYIASNYIKSNLTGNIYTMSTYPMGHKKTVDGVSTYYIEPFSYSYTSEDVVTSISDEFSFVVNSDNQLTSFKSSHTMIDTQDGISYTQKLEYEYTVEYNAREDAPSQAEMIDPTQYFLGYVFSVEAVYSKNNKEVVTSIDKLPSDTYVTFRAKNYSPEKAVDIRMYPNGGSSASGDTSVISIENNMYFHTGTVSEAKSCSLSLIGLYGAQFSTNVTVLPPEIESISYSDHNSYIEVDDSTTPNTRYVYADTTYTGITVSYSPSAVNASDIVASVNSAMEEKVTISVTSSGSGYINYKYVISSSALAGEQFTVTFTSKSKPSVSTSVDYTVKTKIPVNEVSAYLTEHTYTANQKTDPAIWGCYYAEGTKGTVSFTSATEGQIAYHICSIDPDTGEKIEKDYVDTFTYSLNEYTATVTIDSPWHENYNFNTFTLNKDLQVVTFSSDEDAGYRTLKFLIDDEA